MARGFAGRFSAKQRGCGSCDVEDGTTDLVDAGEGVDGSDYDGKDVKAKIAMVTTGQAELVHRQAVWGHRAIGTVTFRQVGAMRGLTGSLTLGNRTDKPAIVPWSGPHGESPGFSFGVSTESGMMLCQTIRRGDRVMLHAMVKATLGVGVYTGAGDDSRYRSGCEGSLDQRPTTNIAILAGGNNLNGVGAVIETARTQPTRT